ncbi:PREDICTED: 28S ribosomal protein S6, mitochondrial-like [Priapulus caudatus]|uniref:Small ribosomal subunit protein bS6m n=1 Tax=Priapulus caudatus TaxID=37621 RepID=A0ABM1FBC5_PRICU|nr:PREDICTED: 28S ribosomal protein S6, mitochondrial-like [Priapulus caudatus]
MAPLYELTLILRTMQRPNTAAALKRTAMAVIDRGGVVSKIENLGMCTLPYKMRRHGVTHTQGSYFLMRYFSPPTITAELMEHIGRDVDIVKRGIHATEDKPEVAPPCTLEEETKPAAYRKDLLSSFRK